VRGPGRPGRLVSRPGILLVLAGPSGVGKGTIGRLLLARDPSLSWSVSATTRAPRPGEVDGVDYQFLDRDQFEARRDAGGFLEWFEVYGQLKGTPRDQVEQRLAAGEDVLMEVDVQGAMAVKEQIPDALLVFLRAPSREVQRARLLERGADDDDQMARRIARAEAEEAQADRFDAVVVNDDADTAVSEVTAILNALRAARENDPGAGA
jgi:guanylate kinase